MTWSEPGSFVLLPNFNTYPVSKTRVGLILGKPTPDEILVCPLISHVVHHEEGKWKSISIQYNRDETKHERTNGIHPILWCTNPLDKESWLNLSQPRVFMQGNSLHILPLSRPNKLYPSSLEKLRAIACSEFSPSRFAIDRDIQLCAEARYYNDQQRMFVSFKNSIFLKIQNVGADYMLLSVYPPKIKFPDNPSYSRRLRLADVSQEIETKEQADQERDHNTNEEFIYYESQNAFSPPSNDNSPNDLKAIKVGSLENWWIDLRRIDFAQYPTVLRETREEWRIAPNSRSQLDKAMCAALLLNNTEKQVQLKGRGIEVSTVFATPSEPRAYYNDKKRNASFFKPCFGSSSSSDLRATAKAFVPRLAAKAGVFKTKEHSSFSSATSPSFFNPLGFILNRIHLFCLNPDERKEFHMMNDIKKYCLDNKKLDVTSAKTLHELGALLIQLKDSSTTSRDFIAASNARFMIERLRNLSPTAKAYIFESPSTDCSLNSPTK